MRKLSLIFNLSLKLYYYTVPEMASCTFNSWIPGVFQCQLELRQAIHSAVREEIESEVREELPTPNKKEKENKTRQREEFNLSIPCDSASL